MKQIIILTMILFFTACSYHQNEIYTPIKSPQSLLEEKFNDILNDWENTPYVLGGSSKKGADCSGFTQSVFAEFNTQIPRTTKTQLQSGKKIKKEELQMGDLVFFKTGHGPNGMHVGIYMQENEFIHLSPNGGLKESSLKNPYWKKRYIGARRYELQHYFTQR